jgi:hypothetical protein
MRYRPVRQRSGRLCHLIGRLPAQPWRLQPNLAEMLTDYSAFTCDRDIAKRDSPRRACLPRGWHSGAAATILQSVGSLKCGNVLQ